MAAKLNVQGFTHPRRSSDYLVELKAERNGIPVRLVAVLDTIGRPNQRPLDRWVAKAADELQNLIETAGEGTLDDLATALCEYVVDRNEDIRALNQDQLPVYGFSALFAICVDGRIRLHWLGDCRAYVFTPERTRKGVLSACQVRCPTPGHNHLHDEVVAFEEEHDEPIELFKSELLELSRKLTWYWGVRERDASLEVLRSQQIDIEPRPGEAVLLATDGFFLPMVRVAASEAGFRLTTERLYLERWLERTLLENELPCDQDHAPPWMDAVRELRKGCLKVMNRRKRYRDDIAVALIEPVV